MLRLFKGTCPTLIKGKSREFFTEDENEWLLHGNHPYYFPMVLSGNSDEEI